MRFDVKNLITNKNCIEIRRRGILYWRIFLFRTKIKDLHTIQSIPGLITEIPKKMKSFINSPFFSIEIDKDSLVFFYLTRENESSNNIYLKEFREIIENSNNFKLEELMDEELEERFWGCFYRNTSFSNIKFEENYFKFCIKDRALHLAIFSIKDLKILKDLLDLIASLKIKQFKLYFNNNTEPISSTAINLSIESESSEKIQELYSIISNDFSRETISLYLPNKSLFTQYLLKFLNSNKNTISQSPKFHYFRTPERFLKSFDFEEVRPLVFIHQKKLISVIILRKLNLRFVKYYLKTYYKKYFLIFWVMNQKLFHIIENNTKLRYLPNCSVQNKKKDVPFWEKALQINSENS